MTHLRKVELVGKPRSVQNIRSEAHISLVHNAPRVRSEAKHALRVPSLGAHLAAYAALDLVSIGIALRYVAAKSARPLATPRLNVGAKPPYATP